MLVVELLRISRPAGWLGAAGIFRIGMAYADARDTPVSWALTLALTFPFCLFLFGTNDLYDAASDAQNPRKGGWLHGGRVDPARAEPIRRAVWIAGLAVLAFALVLPLRAGLVLAGVLAVAILYSRPMGPVPRLKEIPIVDGVASAAIIAGLLALGYALGAPLVDLPAQPFAFVPAIVGLHVFASIMDVDADRNAGHRTLPVRIGARGASIVAFACSVVTVGLGRRFPFAPAIDAYAVAQAAAIGASTLAPRRIPPKLAFVGIGFVSAAAVAYMVLVYL